jgi:hypothetical protein
MRLSPSHWSSEITSKSFFSGCSETLPLGLARPRRPDGLWLRDWLASPLEASTSPRLLNPFAPSCSPISEALHLIPKTAVAKAAQSNSLHHALPLVRLFTSFQRPRSSAVALPSGSNSWTANPPAKAWLRAARWLIVAVMHRVPILSRACRASVTRLASLSPLGTGAALMTTMCGLARRRAASKVSLIAAKSKAEGRMGQSARSAALRAEAIAAPSARGGQSMKAYLTPSRFAAASVETRSRCEAIRKNRFPLFADPASGESPEMAEPVKCKLIAARSRNTKRPKRPATVWAKRGRS